MENPAEKSPPPSSRRRSDEKRRRRSSRDHAQPSGTEQMEVIRYKDKNERRKNSSQSSNRNSVIKWKKVSEEKVGGDQAVVGGGNQKRPSDAKTDKVTRRISSAKVRSRSNSLYDNVNDHLPSYHEMLKIHDESEDIFEVNFQKAVEQVGIQVVPPLSPLVVRTLRGGHHGDFMKKSRSVDDTLDGGRKVLPPLEDPWKLSERRRGSGHLNKFPIAISGKSPNKNHARRSSNEQSSSLARVKRKSLQSQEKLN